MVLTLSSPAKINLTLEVLARRLDGYHDIRSVIQEIPLHDYFTFHKADGIHLHTAPVGILEEDNLITRTVRLLQDTQKIPGARILLCKNIPLGAGLGGGSSNAAITLQGLNALYNLHLSSETLHQYAAQLGSDVPFFLRGGTAMAEGTGTELTPLPPLTGFSCVLYTPPFHVSTAEAYARLPADRLGDKGKTSALVLALLQGQRNALPAYNDFQETLFQDHPELAAVYERFHSSPVLAAGMSGTGPTLFALADHKTAYTLHQTIRGRTFCCRL